MRGRAGWYFVEAEETAMLVLDLVLIGLAVTLDPLPLTASSSWPGSGTPAMPGSRYSTTRPRSPPNWPRSTHRHDAGAPAPDLRHAPDPKPRQPHPAAAPATAWVAQIGTRSWPGKQNSPA